MSDSSEPLTRTRRSLHAVAELLLGGPQFRLSGSIELRQTPGGFGTIAAPDLWVDGVDVVAVGSDERRRLPIGGRSTAELAHELRLTPGAPGVYADACGVELDEPLVVDAAAAAEIQQAYAAGQAALRALAPRERPILWPEHFDLGISLDEVNYGVSPGDSYLPEPYAYVGPWTPRTGPFWNQPFGAARTLRDLGEAAAVEAFFREGQGRL